jgi:4-amino-4-deoxy-L-arabinose transferase-like glycosyltransferase
MKIFSTQFADPRRNFLIVLLLTTLIKFWLAVAIPITGDEAYFYKWGMHLDWGYYDHPPMGGWLLWLMQQFSSELIVLRLPAILLWVVIALGMMDIFRRLQPEQADKAWQLGSLFLLLPFTWALTLVTTDTPLIFFLFFSSTQS